MQGHQRRYFQQGGKKVNSPQISHTISYALLFPPSELTFFRARINTTHVRNAMPVPRSKAQSKRVEAIALVVVRSSGIYTLAVTALCLRRLKEERVRKTRWEEEEEEEEPSSSVFVPPSSFSRILFPSYFFPRTDEQKRLRLLGHPGRRRIRRRERGIRERRGRSFPVFPRKNIFPLFHAYICKTKGFCSCHA